MQLEYKSINTLFIKEQLPSMLMDSSLNAFPSLLRQLVFGPTNTETK